LKGAAVANPEPEIILKEAKIAAVVEPSEAGRAGAKALWVREGIENEAGSRRRKPEQRRG
jgi:predicted CoA-binding protein